MTQLRFPDFQLAIREGLSMKSKAHELKNAETIQGVMQPTLQLY